MFLQLICVNIRTHFVLHDFYRLLQDGGISWGQVEQDLPFTSETPSSRNLQMLEQIRWHSHALWNFAGHTIVLPIQVPAGSCGVKAVVDKNAILRCYMILTCFCPYFFLLHINFRICFGILDDVSIS